MHGNSKGEAGFDYSSLDTFYGYYLDNEKLLKSSSGGAVSAISEAVIRQGGLVFGVSYSDDFKRAEYRCVDNLKDLDFLKGSKYCESTKEIMINNESLSIYTVLEEKIKDNKLILFVGLGCDIGGIKAFCETKKLDTCKLYTIELLCYGTTTSIVHQQYIEGLEKEYKCRIKAFTVRYKKEGWIPPYIHAEFENGSVYDIPFSESDYGFAFSRFSKRSCYECRFKGDNHKADIICGDFWGLTKSMPCWNRNGVSILFVKTPKGKELIEMIDKSSFHIDKADTSFAMRHNPSFLACRTKDKRIEQFNKALREKGLHYAVKHYAINPRARIKSVLPKCVIIALKAFKDRIH